ncbi:tetratricopeptide repeat protein, partial [Mycobacterium tuberculosis]
TAQTVYSGYADGKGLESVLSSTDQVVASLRSRLGETLKSVQRDSTPLPQVTTADLDALRAYALGVTAYSEHRYREALDYFDQAIRIDPDFAFAYIGSMRVHFSQGEYSLARGFYRKALTLRGQ